MQKAIMQSGGGISDRPSLADHSWRLQNKQEKHDGTRRLQKPRGMRSASVDSIMALINRARRERREGMMGPVVDGYVLPTSFSEATRTNKIADIPYIIGYNTDDMGMMKNGLGNFASSVKLLEEMLMLMSFAGITWRLCRRFPFC